MKNIVMIVIIAVVAGGAIFAYLENQKARKDLDVLRSATTEPSVNSPEEVVAATYDVQLVSCDVNKINAIKMIRKVTGKSLKEAKAVLSLLPVLLASGKFAEEAKAITEEFKKSRCKTKVIKK